MSNVILLTVGFERISLLTVSTDNVDGVMLKNTPESTYALGLLYIHSYLESKGHNVKTLLMNTDPLYVVGSKINVEINNTHPDFIGIQILTSNRTDSFEIIEWIHKNFPNIKIIVGGIHTTIMYEQIIKKYPFVVAVIGEGEITFLELIEANDISTVNGIAYWNNGVIKTPTREPIQNLDILPFPKHENVFKDGLFDDEVEKRKFASVITSRGCYSSCSFCVLNPNEKRTVRYRSVKNVVDEIEYLHIMYPDMTTVFFQDDSFTSDNQRVIDICNEIVHRELNVLNYWCSGRIKPFRADMIPYMEQAGFQKICFGMESGNDEILKKCHKGFRQKDIIETIKKLKHSSIEPVLFLIIGLPGETKETIEDTIHLIHHIQRKIRYVFFQDAAIASVYPGTELYNIMKSTGKIDDDYWMTDKPTPIYDLEHTFNELLEMKRYMLDNVVLLPITPMRFFNQLPNLINIIRFKFKL